MKSSLSKAQPVREIIKVWSSDGEALTEYMRTGICKPRLEEESLEALRIWLRL